MQNDFNIYSLARSKYGVFIYLSLSILFYTIILSFLDETVFYAFIGNFNPILLIVLIFILGFILLNYLNRVASFEIFRKSSLEDFFFIGSLAIFISFVVMVADIWFADYSADINVLFPYSLMFYPIAAYVAEIIFHLVPLFLIIFIFSGFRKIPLNKIIWVGIFFTSLTEPLFQSWYIGECTLATQVFTSVHVFIFGLIQLLIFKYYDFITMYFFRIVYYLFWHIIWGYIRLGLLFN